MLSFDVIFSRSHCESRCLALLAYAKNQQNDDMLNYAVYAWGRGGCVGSLDAYGHIFVFRSCHRRVISLSPVLFVRVCRIGRQWKKQGAQHASKTHTVTMINSDSFPARRNELAFAVFGNGRLELGKDVR
jgi:hypothetical protein